jgi:ribokinase
MVQFTVVGSLNYDLVSYTERVPKAGETFQGDSFETHIGGKGLNQTIALARMVQGGDKVRMIGNVGDDAFGKQLKSSLVRNGVDVSNVRELEGVPSGVAVIIVEKANGENRILITPGANGYTEYTDDQLDQLFATDQEVVVFQNEIPGTQSTIEWLHEYRPQITVVYNPSPYYKFSADMVNLVDVLIVNEGESMSIAKDILSEEEYQHFESSIDNDVISGYKELAHTLQTRLNIQKAQSVVITLGHLGSIYTSKDTSGYIEATEVEKVVDTTGAGDTFLGAFLTQLFKHGDIAKAVKLASNASSLAIQKNGASDSIPTYNEVIKL